MARQYLNLIGVAVIVAGGTGAHGDQGGAALRPPLPVVESGARTRAEARPAPEKPGAWQGYGPVRRGETLWGIAGHLYPEQGVTRDQIMLALLKANPQAFASACNANAPLRTGAVLRLPPLAAVQSITPADARRKLSEQEQAWAVHRRTGKPLACPPIEEAAPAAPAKSKPPPAQSSERVPPPAPAAAAPKRGAPPTPPAPVRVTTPAQPEPPWKGFERAWTRLKPFTWTPLALILGAALIGWAAWRRQMAVVRESAQTALQAAGRSERLDIAEVMRELQTDCLHGLTAQEAQRRLRAPGVDVAQPGRVGLLRQLRSQVRDPVPWALAAAALVILLLGDARYLILLAALWLLMVVLGHRQAARGRNALAYLQDHLGATAQVLRDGEWQQVSVHDLVPGDILRLHAGEIVPADAKLIAGTALSVDQSVISGKSLPVSKATGDMAFLGTAVKAGEMVAVVTATGGDTLLARTRQHPGLAYPRPTDASAPWRMLRIWPARLRELNGLLWLAALSGMLGALVTVLFREGIRAVQWLLTARSGSLVAMAETLPAWERLLLPAAGGLAAGLVLQEIGARLRGRTTTDYMEAVSLGDGWISIRQSLVRALSSLLSVGTGASIGREGAMVQLAAMVASAVGRGARLAPDRLRLLVASGAAAGLASAYNAPIASTMFVAEIVLGSIALEHIGPLVVGSVIANATVHRFLGYAPVYDIPNFRFVSNWELVLYLLLGLVAGQLAPRFLKLLDLASHGFKRLPVPLYARMALGGLLVGAISVYEPQVWGNGYSTVNAVLHASWPWQALATVLILKLLATAATIGSGAVGGAFTPTLFVGAMLGALFGTLTGVLFPAGIAAPSAYAVVGMGAMLAGTTQAPLMSILMVFELTLDYQIVLPLMLACITAHYTALHYPGAKSIYAESLLPREGSR